MLTGSMYVDLNQMKAGQASSLIDSEHSSIRRRILAAKQREAEESRQAFACAERSEDYAFPASTAFGLFEDCWLSPIDQDGPLITGEATRLTPLIRTRVLEGLVAMMAVGGVTPEETDVGSAVLEELAETLLHWGLNPKPWVAHLQDMAVRCHHLLGHAELVESRAQQDAQRCYYGITFCREVFGSPKPTAAEFP